jgi:hypothetical protein
MPIACGTYGMVASSSMVAGGAAWLVALAASLAGWGHLVERAARLVRPDGPVIDLGLRMAWGATAYLAIAGWALALGILTAPILIVLIVGGLAGFAWRMLTAAPDPLDVARRALAAARANPQGTALLAVIVGLTAVNLLAAIARAYGNVYDDDVIYTPLVRRLLDVGDLEEPFSFRRISAYGGQTVLQAAGAARGTLVNLFLVDGGLFHLIVLFLIDGMARGRPATATAPAVAPADRFVVALVLLVVVLLPRYGYNTASYWTGVAMFLALYRTLALAASPDVAATRVLAIAGGVAAGACTLRQSYLPVAALTLVLVLIARLSEAAVGEAGRAARLRTAWRAQRRTWLFAIAGGAVALVPYCIATWRSSETFLFPFQRGTFNPSIQLTPTVMSAWQELQMFIKVALEPEPIRVFATLLPVFVLARDLRSGRPLSALTLATAIGFGLLVHSFALSDSANLWRYAFGYTMTLVIAVAIEGGRPGLGRGVAGEVPVRVPVIGRIVIVVSLLIQLATSGRMLQRRYQEVGADLDAAFAAPRRALDLERAYASLQLAAPAGTPIAVLLDEPAYLDYARNRILNLDTPGYASWRPGMPFFRGPEPVAAYFLEHGVRHIAFVRGEASRYMYRRDEWMRRLLVDTELWRIQSAYLIDCVDNFAALAASRAVLYEEDGMVMIDLGVRR